MTVVQKKMEFFLGLSRLPFKTKNEQIKKQKKII